MQRGRRYRGSWGIGLIVTLVCLLVSFFAAKLTHRAGSAGFGSVTALNLDNVAEVQTVPNGFVYYNGTAVARVGSDGVSKWSYSIGKNAGFDANENGVAAWCGTTITLIDETSGTIGYTGTFDNQVLSARTGSQYCAVCLAPDGNSTIMLMEKTGKSIDSITLEDQLVVDYGFFYDGSLFWVMTLDSNGTAPSCTISVYRPGKRIVGNISDVEQVIYRPVFRSNDILCGGETYLKTYSYTGEEDSDARKLIYGYVIADVYQGTGSPTIALVSNDQYGGDSELKDVRVLKGSTDIRLHMPFACVGVVAQEYKVYGFSQDGVVTIGDIETGEMASYQISAACREVSGITSDGKAVLVNGNTIYLVSLE